jgi:hypothetical protein
MKSKVTEQTALYAFVRGGRQVVMSRTQRPKGGIVTRRLHGADRMTPELRVGSSNPSSLTGGKFVVLCA